MIRVLVLEDDETLQRAIERHVRRRGIDVVAARTVAEAKEAVRTNGPFHAALLDLWLPDGRGLDFLAQLEPDRPRPRSIVMTGEASVDSAVNAMRLGVVDYLLKPFSLTALDAALARVVAQPTREEASVTSPTSREHARAWKERYAPEMIGDDPRLLGVFDTLARVSATDCSILVQGETGTGKELVARAIHAGSGRGARPFVAVNCAAVPEQLMESELFGHGRGAYTGAVERRIGRFAAADGGTLFLDEIGEMPLALQAKLLRALQEKEIVPLGENKPVSVDVRVVAATHRDLEALVAEGRFREDLLYRLDVIRLELPPLRERPGDLPALVETLISRANERRRTTVTGITPEAMDAFVAFGWPGNVRQLLNVVERAVLLRVNGMLGLEDIPERITSSRQSAVLPVARVPADASPTLPEEGIDLREAVERFEASLIRQALARTGWNKNRAAALLRLNRTTLVEKLKKRGWLEDESVESPAIEPEGPPVTRRLRIAQ